MFGCRLDIARQPYLQSSCHNICIPTLMDKEENKTRKDFTFSLYNTVEIGPISPDSTEPTLVFRYINKRTKCHCFLLSLKISAVVSSGIGE
jgi:hypothetical protein